MNPREESLTVSVIVPAYRRPERLSELLRTLLHQEFPSKGYEVIVVDDGSPEEVCSIVRQFSEVSEVAVRCFWKANGGPASARAFGAAKARGAYLLFVDDDMLVGKDFVREHVQTQREMGPAAVICDFDWEVEAEPKSFERWYKKTVMQWRNARQAALLPIGDGLFEFSAPLSGGDFLTAANLSVEKSDYLRVGGFDTAYRSPGCEDQDFGVRLRKAGVRRIVTTRTRATHIETALTLAKVCRRQEAGWKDAVRFMRRLGLLDQPVELEIAVVNGPVRKVDPWRLAAKKVLKTLVASDRLSRISFYLVRILDRMAPESASVQRSYDLLVGAYLRKGWLKGLQVYDGDGPSEALSHTRVT
jgi:glycosyltransferase involved in cell wall biosynthesis